MNNETLNFKKFLEAEQIKPNYANALQDELGINPDHLKGTDWAANIQMGKNSYNQVTYKVVKMVEKNGVYTGAIIQAMKVPGITTQRAYGKDQMRLSEPRPEGAPFEISIDKFNELKKQGTMDASAAGGGVLPGGSSI